MAASVTPGAKPESAWSKPMTTNVVPGDLPKGKGNGRANRRPPPPTDTQGASSGSHTKEALLDAKTRAAFVEAHARIATDELKFITQFQKIVNSFYSLSTREKKDSELAINRQIDALILQAQALRPLIAVTNEAAGRMKKDDAIRAQIDKILSEQDLVATDPVKQDEIDAKIALLVQRPTPSELLSKKVFYSTVITGIERFKKSLTDQNGKLEGAVQTATAIVSMPNDDEVKSKLKEKKIDDELVPLVRGLLKTKEELLGEITDLDNKVPQHFLRLIEVIQLYKSVHGEGKKNSDDPSLVRCASLCAQPLEVPVSASLTMQDAISTDLVTQVKRIETLWAEVGILWRTTTDETRRCSMLLEEKRPTYFTDYLFSLGRPHVGPDARKVKSFNLSPLLYERPKEATGWSLWPFGTSQPSSSTPTTSSSEPVKPAS